MTLNDDQVIKVRVVVAHAVATRKSREEFLSNRKQLTEAMNSLTDEELELYIKLTEESDSDTGVLPATRTL